MENYELFEEDELIKDEEEIEVQVDQNIRHKQNYFCTNIEKLVQEKKLTYLESIVFFCEKHDLPIEHVPQLLNSSIRGHLYNEGMDLHLLKKINQLPI